jgi:hypothetical protein
MTRIIAGVAGGRRLEVPAGRSTRPTADRAREGMFATVLAVRGPLDGARVLDLYAGSGAVGLEALSRGASDVLLVESDPRAASVIRRNIDALRLPGARLLADRVDRVLARGPGDGPPRDVALRGSGRGGAPGACLTARARLARAWRSGRRGASNPRRRIRLARRVYARAVPRLR